MDSPFFAWLFSSAKIRSCLRSRLAFSMPLVTAMSTSWVTCSSFSSDRCMGIAVGPVFGSAAESGRGEVRTASGCAACGLLILGVAPGSGARFFLVLLGLLAAPDIRRGDQQR